MPDLEIKANKETFDLMISDEQKRQSKSLMIWHELSKRTGWILGKPIGYEPTTEELIAWHKESKESGYIFK